MSARLRFQVAGLLALASCLVACAGPEAGVSRATGAIIGGAPTEGDPAVVLLVSYPADLSTFDSCTASLIAGDVLLTAAHCLDPETHPGYSFGVFNGPDASAYPTASTLVPQLLAVKEAHPHPDYDPSPPFVADIGVAILEEPMPVAPLPIQRDALDEGIEGQPARIVGYGQTKYKQPNAVKHEATTVVASLDEGDTVTVGDLERRSCIGDSGGPALVTIDGVERIVGVDSYTELSGCLEPAHYRRTDVYTRFLDVYAPAGGAGAGGTGDGGAGAGGTGGTGDSGGGGADGNDGGGGCSIGRAPGADHGPARDRDRAAWAAPLLLLSLGAWLRGRRRERAGARPARPDHDLAFERS